VKLLTLSGPEGDWLPTAMCFILIGFLVRGFLLWGLNFSIARRWSGCRCVIEDRRVGCTCVIEDRRVGYRVKNFQKRDLLHLWELDDDS